MTKKLMTKGLSSAFQVVHEVPPHIALPVGTYGGTERVVQGLLGGLVAANVNVKVRCSGDSFPDPVDRRNFKLTPTCDKAFGMDAAYFGPKKTIEESLHNLLKYATDRNCKGKPTLIHAHTEDTHLMVAKCFNTRAIITTVHNLPKPWVQEFFSDFPMVAISRAQAKSTELQGFDFVRTVYNGIDKTLYKPNFNVAPDAPLVYLGRICEKKGAGLAVKIAIESGQRLVLAGPKDAEEPEFFDRVIKPALEKYPHLISYVEGVSDILEPGEELSSKCRFLREAKALLFPIQWKEPFGMVMAEAMACGTPVIAINYPGSSVDEIIRHGVNGYKVTDGKDAAMAVKLLGRIDRQRVYSDFINRFTVDKMTEGYIEVYREAQDKYLPQTGAVSQHKALQDMMRVSRRYLT